MRKLLIAIVLSVGFGASAQIDLRINVPLPTVRFEAPPPLVYVEPGVQVVPDHDEEIFFVNGVYWTRRDGRWFRSRDHRGGWVMTEERAVPQVIVRVPPGKYRHWHAEAREERHELREERREEHHEWREHEREEHERHEGEEHGHGHRRHDHDGDEH